MRTIDTIPHAHDADEVQPVVDRLNELKQEITAMETRLAELNSELVDDEGQGGQRRQQLAERADALIQGDYTPGTPTDTRGEIRETIERLRVTRTAVDKLERELPKAIAAASRKYAEEIRPRYESIVSDMADAIRALRAACQHERELREEVNAAGWSVFPSYVVPVPFLHVAANDFDDDQFTLWLKEASGEYEI